MAQLLLICALVFQLLVGGLVKSQALKESQDQLCHPNENQSRFEVLPGRGWDNLRNVDMGQVYAANYSDCRYSDDGRYFVPLTVQLLPRKASKVQLFSDVYSTFRDYSSLTSFSINRAGHGDFDGKIEISGSFSAEHQKVKTTQINTRSVTTRVQLRHTLYTAMQEPDTPLAAGFRDRLLNLAYELESNNTKMADYLADMVIADYGTHYVTTVDAGAVYASIDFIRNDRTSLTDAQTSDLKMSAAVNFEKVAGFNSSYGFAHKTNNTSGYNSNLTDSTFITEGGPALGPGASAKDWVAGLERNLVPVDRSGAPLFYAIHMGTLGGLSPMMVGAIRSTIQNAVERYYHANTIVGCMERDSENFNMLANVASDDCKAPQYNHSFGGVFQTCYGDSDLCKEVTVPNPMTGGPSCADGFRAIHLWSRVYKCKSSCHGWWVFKQCRQLCATYSLFWCASTTGMASSSKETYLFGGVYNNHMANPLTGSQSCPPAYYALKMGSSGLEVCLSRDFELGQEHAFEFGGFFSCDSGNPYTLHLRTKDSKSVARYIFEQSPSLWPKRCPDGFAQHMADIDGACEIMYCIRSHAFRQAKPAYVRRPPFTKIPGGMVPNPAPVANAISFSLSSSGDQWVRDPQTNSWSFSTNRQSLVKDIKSQPWLIVASVLGSVLGTLLLGLLIAIIILRRQKKAPTLLSGYSNPCYSACIQGGQSNVSPRSDTNAQV